MNTKVCRRCNTEKPFVEFNKDKKEKDGYKSHCKQCRKEYYQKNKEKIIRRVKEYCEENKPKILVRNKKYYEANKEKIAEKGKIYREANKEKIAERDRRYRQTEHSKKMSYIYKLKRKSYKHKVRFNPHERKHILDRDNWTCCNCGCKVHDIRKRVEYMTPDERNYKAHIDHIIPISKGGSSELKNLRVLCARCNSSKSDKQDEQLILFKF